MSAMNAGIHKLTAGDGYVYLTRQVAAADATHRGRPSLADYYSSKGESPGRWVGRGLAGLGEPGARGVYIPAEVADKGRQLWSIATDSAVTEDHMRALFGLGMHPNALQITNYLINEGAHKTAAMDAAQLGRPFYISDDTRSELEQRIAVAYRDYNILRGEHWAAAIDDEIRAQMRTQIARELFAKSYGREPSDDRELSGFIARESREPTTSVAGYDITFTPVKSVSVLWALAPLAIAQTIEDCHDRAVADALEYLQEHAAFTRTGAGGVAQIDTEGFIAAAFTHRDSRSGDPNLHTHVAVSNKVCAVRADGSRHWLALDGKPLYKANVAASELYNTHLEAHLIAALGLAFVERESERGKRPIREVVGVSGELREVFSPRRAAIEQLYGQLATQFQATHGREPTTPEAIALYQRATLVTREAKHEPRSLAEQRGQWRGQAVELLGSSAELAAMIARVLSGRREAAREITPEWVAEQAEAVVETVSAGRSVWQRTHVYAEAQRRVREHNLHAETGLAERITDAALRDYSIDFAHDLDADMGEPALLRRRDGSSIYSSHGTQFFTSAAVLDAEKKF